MRQGEYHIMFVYLTDPVFQILDKHETRERIEGDGLTPLQADCPIYDLYALHSWASGPDK
jgi:hypothetical protein